MKLLLLYRLMEFLGSPVLFWSLLKKRRPLWSRKLKPPALKENRPLLWVHALSVGEVQAARALLEALRKELPSYALFLTVATVSGFQLAQKSLKGLYDHLWTSPMDLFPVVRRFQKVLSPRAFILVETDLWPETLWSLKTAGVPLFLINAALSVRAQRRLARFLPLAHFLYDPFDFIGAATIGDQKRLSSLLSREIFYFGNLKFDLPPPSLEEVEGIIKELAPFLDPPVIVCGSTHPGEEELWLRAWCLLKRGSLILCPRQPKRASEILALAESLGLEACLRSQPRKTKILVVDTLGELRKLYALAEIAFVGGSLVPVGGHNLIEPAQWGKPILFGPYVESVADLAEELEEAGAARRLLPEPENMARIVQEILPRARDFGKQALMVVKHHRGAARQYARLVAEHLEA